MANDLAQALTTADRLFERDRLEFEIGRLADELVADHVGERPVYLTIMNGGMLFAAQLALAIGERLDLEFDYLHATRYRGDTVGASLHWLRLPTTSLVGRKVVLVDDILDEGHTLSEVKAWCLAHGAAEVRVAALAVKQHDRCLPDVKADYVGVHVPDRYVFGYGMDFHEQGRNLPAIFALTE